MYLKCIPNIPAKLAFFIFFYPALNPLVVIITLGGFLIIIGLVRAFIHSIKNWSILFRISNVPYKIFLQASISPKKPISETSGLLIASTFWV